MIPAKALRHSEKARFSSSKLARCHAIAVASEKRTAAGHHIGFDAHAGQQVQCGSLVAKPQHEKCKLPKRLNFSFVFTKTSYI